VLELQADQIREAPAFNSMLDAGYITGLGSINVNNDGVDATRMLILIDIERLMTSADMGLVDSVLQ